MQRLWGWSVYDIRYTDGYCWPRPMLSIDTKACKTQCCPQIPLHSGVCGREIHSLCWLAVTINLTKPRITWEDSCNERLLILVWPVSYLRISIVGINWCGKTQPTVYITVHLVGWGEDLTCITVEKPGWAWQSVKTVNEHAFTLLCSWLWVWCVQPSQAVACSERQ